MAPGPKRPRTCTVCIGDSIILVALHPPITNPASASMTNRVILLLPTLHLIHRKVPAGSSRVGKLSRPQPDRLPGASWALERHGQRRIATARSLDITRECLYK